MFGEFFAMMVSHRFVDFVIQGYFGHAWIFRECFVDEGLDSWLVDPYFPFLAEWFGGFVFVDFGEGGHFYCEGFWVCDAVGFGGVGVGGDGCHSCISCISCNLISYCIYLLDK
jgi:hypothetical protein